MKRWEKVAWAVVLALLAVVPAAHGLDQVGIREPLRLLQSMTGTSASFTGVVSAVTLDGGSIRGTTGNFSGPVVVSDTLSAQTLDAGYLRIYGNATVSGTASVGVLDGGAIIGTTLNLSSAIKADTLTLATKAPTGAWAVHWDGVVAESINGEGGYKSDNVTPGYFEYVACSCRVAGSGGSDGITVELFEDGLSADAVEITGGDANACDDAAGTMLTGLLHFPPTNATYSLQFKSSTDCASNPTDCTCNVMIER